MLWYNEHMWKIGAIGSLETVRDLPRWTHATVLPVPVIRFEPVAFQLPEEPADWIFFGSKRGVKAFLEQAGGLPAGVKVGAVGSRTATVLSMLGIEATFVPTRFSSRWWPKEFVDRFPEARHILLPTSDRSAMETPKEFHERGIRLTRLVCYRTCCADHIDLPDDLDALVLASPSSVDCLRQRLGDRVLEGRLLVSIGDVTAKRLRELGYASAVPDRFTMADAVRRAVQLLEETKASDGSENE